MIVSSELIKNIDAGKFIPIIREYSADNIPKFIETKLYLDFTNDEYFGVVFDDLLRTLLGAEISSKPPLGEAPDFYSSPVEQKTTVARSRAGLSVEAFEIFEKMVRQYDAGTNAYWNGVTLRQDHNFGRVTFDAAMIELRNNSLIGYVEYQDRYYMSEKGILFSKSIGLV